MDMIRKMVAQCVEQHPFPSMFKWIQYPFCQRALKSTQLHWSQSKTPGSFQEVNSIVKSLRYLVTVETLSQSGHAPHHGRSLKSLLLLGPFFLGSSEAVEAWSKVLQLEESFQAELRTGVGWLGGVFHVPGGELHVSGVMWCIVVQHIQS